MSKDKKSLAETHPEVAKQWHPNLNGDLTPYDFTPGSGKKVWWKCPEGDDHEWEKSINKRAGRGDGCLICSNRKIVNSNCLSTTHPEIAEQWHPTKNGELIKNTLFPKKIKLKEVKSIREFAGDLKLITEKNEFIIDTQIVEPNSLLELKNELKNYSL